MNRPYHNKLVHIKTATDAAQSPSILVIYTGGTIGMDYDQSGKHLIPFDFKDILEKVPELRRFELRLTVLEPFSPMDSSNITIMNWVQIANVIHEYYEDFDAFVVLHGTDTMAYSASAVSFLLEDLNKPVIFTGSQIPIGATRTDARENFISALEIAAAKEKNLPIVPEVCIFFDDLLLRGNRSRKVESVNFTAFESNNYPHLAEAGIYISYNRPAIRKPTQDILWLYEKMDNNVTFLKVFPSISQTHVEAILSAPKLRGIVLESFGSGNIPTHDWFHHALEKAVKKGIFIYNVSQCAGGTVIQGRYETSSALNSIGVISGRDITPEAAITKLMFLLGNEESESIIRQKLSNSLAGEMSEETE